ncbi:glycosyltransferase family 4 protein [Roseateles sp.]|uniref:glycosyltransferase family 4 protein n=1 Tax=Roseateles sp. TaxID=1971397 RepID=UPI003BA54A4E
MGRYVYDMIENASATSNVDWVLFGDDERYPMSAPANMQGRSEIFPFRGDRFQLWEQLGLPQRAKALKVDLLHCTEGTLPLWQPVPTVVTLHDTLAWEEHDNDAWSRFYWNQLMPRALARCAAVITISDCSRRDILARWPSLEPKLTVIPHGINAAYLDEAATPTKSELQLQLRDHPYLVYLGGPLPRKRFDWALKVLQALNIPNLHLVACGFGAAARPAAEVLVPASLRDRVCFAPFLADDHLLALYRGASAVLYPTLYEGFGFPAIEAQAAGTPAIFSDLGSLAELVGPLADIVPPTDLAAWVAAVKRALELGEERLPKAAAARLWASRFSWARSSQDHVRVYERVSER